MSTIKTTLFAAIVAAITQPAFAHSGHDHDHWSSNFLHLGILAGLVAGVVLLRYLLKQPRQKQK